MTGRGLTSDEREKVTFPRSVTLPNFVCRIDVRIRGFTVITKIRFYYYSVHRFSRA